ncbi:transcriptional regulator, LuxR family [Mycolicibacterium rhodesiae JS60]|nr:transcriptional regulator, LuxR family [Mycolicibacterium rhodesiae JS60]
MSELPTGTVTLLLADVERSTQLWENQPEEMTAAIARLDSVLADVSAIHSGVRPVEQGEGDSFVLAFARASEAVNCALDLQRATLVPIRLRIGLHTGEIQLRDEGNYIGPTINRTARLRDLAHGGQTVLSGVTEAMVVDHLPDGAWLSDLGPHALRGLPRPERVVQLCHPDVRSEFPPLRTSTTPGVQRLPAQLTSFVGRRGQIDELRDIVASNRLVTLTGAGGSGKTRLAIQVAGELGYDVRYVDLAPITDPELVSVALARVLGLPDQPDRSATDTIVRYLGERRLLIVLDNCEHLLDACAALTHAVVDGCPAVTTLATSREPIGLAGEVTWRIPSLSLTDEAIELFVDRARLVRPDFRMTDDNAAAVTEICRRLDGMPLAIELAAARTRALSIAEISESLHDRFRLLTGGSRTAVRRQQTLRASVDWSHALLTEPERVLFRRLAVFVGGFDLAAVQTVCSDETLERHQILDLLTLLVDKSLVVAEEMGDRTRYRMLETVRQYGLEKLGDSSEANAVRTRHQNHFTAMAAECEDATRTDQGDVLVRTDRDIDNFRSAFTWSRERSDTTGALTLASALCRFWLARGHIKEALAWFEAVSDDQRDHGSDVAPMVGVRAVADRAFLEFWAGLPGRVAEVDHALATARELGDPALLVRALVARAIVVGFDENAAQPYFSEASELARELGHGWLHAQMLAWQAYIANVTGDPVRAGAAAEEGRNIAESIGDRFVARACNAWLGWAYLLKGDLKVATSLLKAVRSEAEDTGDLTFRLTSLLGLTFAMSYQGDETGYRATTKASEGLADELGSFYSGLRIGGIAVGGLSFAELESAAESGATAREQLTFAPPQLMAHWAYYPMAEAALGRGELAEAHQWSETAASMTTGWGLAQALMTRARVALAEMNVSAAERYAHGALGSAAEVQAHLVVPDVLECLARVLGADGSQREATRLCGAAEAARGRTGAVRFKIYDADHEANVVALRDGLGDNDFDAAWAEGAAMPIAEAIAYAQRGRGTRKRPPSGWASLTPTELNVVRLVGEGLGNKDIAARLFVSHRTVQTHLTHVYTKLGLASRLHLAQEASRRAESAPGIAPVR